MNGFAAHLNATASPNSARGLAERAGQAQWVFVYGTLRSDYRERPFGGAALDSVRGCTAPGDMYMVGNAYPVVDFDGGGTVVGELVLVDTEHARFDSIDRMELGAGYKRRQIEVTRPDGEVVEALAYDMDSNRSWAGDRVSSGDFVSRA